MTTSKSLQALALLCAAFVWSCGGSVDASKDDKGSSNTEAEKDENGDAPVECVLTGGACPEGCSKLTGRPVDPERGCTLEREVIGCAPADGAFPDEVGCYVKLDGGTTYWTPNLYSDLPGFRECSESERNWEHEKACQDSPKTCELRADGTCPEGCGPLTGWPLDEARGCLDGSETIGCIEEGSSFPGAIGCQVEIESGTVYATPALYPMQTGYRQCDEAEQSASVSMSQCE